MPSYEIILKRKYDNVYLVWKDSSRLLYRHSRHYIEHHQKPLNLRIGCELTVFKRKITNDEAVEFVNDDSDDDEGIMMEELYYTSIVSSSFYTHYLYVKINTSSNTLVVHTHEVMKQL